jgi:hypothetical protein
MTAMFIDRLTLKDLEDTLANSTPLLALVGAGDLAVEKLRTAREDLAGRAGSFDPKAVRDQAQGRVVERVESLQAEMMAAPQRLQAIPERAQEWPARAQSIFADVVSAAFSTYGELAGRGKTVVSQVRRDVPAGVEIDVTPLSRPQAAARRSATKTTSPKTTSPKTSAAKASTAAKSTAAKSTAAKSTAAKKATASKSSATKSTAQPSTRKTSTTKSSTAKTSASKASSTKAPAAKASTTKAATTKKASTSSN